MTAEPRHHISGSLGLAVGLAATAGFVDAFVYLRVTPVFVANMSGNLVRLGIAAGDHQARTVAAALVALTGFLGGAVLATTHLDTRLRAGRAPAPAPLLIWEALLLVLIAAILRQADVHYMASIRPIGYLVVVLGALAMGIQAVALRRVGQIAVSTTYGTGAVVRLGEKVALALRGADRPGDVRRRRTIAVLGIVLFAYISGACVASSVGSSPAYLLLAAAVPFTAGCLGRRLPGRGVRTVRLIAGRGRRPAPSSRDN